MGKMDRRDVSTSRIERQNLTLRNFVRRLNRKTICFSKKLEKPAGGPVTPLHLVQFRSDPPDSLMHTGDGGRSGEVGVGRWIGCCRSGTKALLGAEVCFPP